MVSDSRSIAAQAMSDEENTSTTGGDLFPSSPREIYANAPLIQVSSELRFPSILKIERDVPADFQERIRRTFPLFEAASHQGFQQLPSMPQLPAEMLRVIGSQLGVGTAYHFRTEDRKSTITLTGGSLSLTTGDYKRWSIFREQLRLPLAALTEIYQPAFFARVGLRYIDAIHRESLGLIDRPWSALLLPHLLGELALPQFERNAEQAAREITLRIPDGTGTITLRHGYGVIQGKSGRCYMIDFDLFENKKTEVGDVERLLDHFNQLAGYAFRSCITPELRDALGPTDTGSG
jgi:uncharacterized protein (TIGR04255 family)